MSRSRSASLEIVPPATSRVRATAAAVDAAPKTSRKQADDEVEDADAEAEVDEIDEQAPASKPAVASSNQPNAPKPCERCARTNKPCKGPAGFRCDYCKRLKQKCSNSTGPARGKTTSTTKKPADTAVVPKGTANKAAGPSQLPPQPPNPLKRKAPGAPQNGNAENHSLDGEGSTIEDEGHDAQARLNKKRRLSKGNGGPTRAQLVKAVNDFEASIKRIQTSVAKEVEKMTAVVKTLNVKIKEMDDE